MPYSERQIEIIKASTELISEGGIQGLTTKALAEKMGFSEPALYRHFEGKTQILSAVLNYYKVELHRAIQEIIESDRTALLKLKEILNFQFQHFSKNPAIVMVIFAETSFQYEKVLSDTVKQILLNKKKKVESIIGIGQEEGSIRKDIQSSQIAAIFMGSMRFTILQWRLNDYQFDLIKEGELLWAATSKIICCKQ